MTVPSGDGSNWTRKVVAVQEQWSFGPYVAYKRDFYGPWHLRKDGELVLTAESLQTIMDHAQGMSAGTAETPPEAQAEGRQPGPKDAP